MRVRLNYIAPVLAAGTIVAAVAVAPIAAAAPSQGASGGTQNQCQSPGNAQVYDAPPQVDFFPYAGGAT
jgi:hypothetical protein